jgi:hypothetical protein
MKRKLILLVSSLAILCASTAQVQADDGGAIVIDVIVARPACLAATIVGGAFFVLSLPFALTSRSVRWTKETLVVNPARATFTRPLGDFDFNTD